MMRLRSIAFAAPATPILSAPVLRAQPSAEFATRFVAALLFTSDAQHPAAN